MQLFAFNRKFLDDDDATITPIRSLHKDATMPQPQRLYRTQLKNQAKTMKNSALNLLGQRSSVTDEDSIVSNLDQKDKSPRNKAINARDNSSRFRAAELSALYELNDNDAHTTLNPIAVIPLKNAGPSLRSKIPQLRVKHTNPAAVMSHESNENPSDVVPRKSLNEVSRRRSFDIAKQIRNNLGRSQRNLSTSRFHVEEFATTIESRDDRIYRFEPFLHTESTELQRDRTMSKDSCYCTTEEQPTDSQRILPVISQDLPDLC